MVNFDDLLDNPSLLIGFLVGFILLLVPTSTQIFLLIVAEYANETGHGSIGSIINCFLDMIGGFTTWLVLTFIESVTYVIVVAFVFFSIAGTIVRMFK
ncbi:hypothetical protein V7O61_10600 [Methanolobus sp. WCC1]|uniref:hypothetical protein n=1 Tax=unclassified Methanolobus TaxID=2629569 RepID=UPI0032535C46